MRSTFWSESIYFVTEYMIDKLILKINFTVIYLKNGHYRVVFKISMIEKY